MSLNLNIPLVYTCETCGAECTDDSVNLLTRIRSYRHQVCAECEAEAVQWAMFEAHFAEYDPIADPYTRTTDTCIVRESDMDAAAYQRWLGLLLGLIAIAAGVAAAKAWMGV